MVDSSDVSHLAFAKKLADNDLQARTATLKGLATFFTKSGPMKEVDLIKIWMGLWYAMWMSDKPVVQRELAESISKLVHTHSSADNAILFIKVFYSTMHREFPKIDRLRHDKFLKFARIFMSNSLKYIKNKDYDADLIEKYHAAVTAEWQRDDAQEIQLHMCDVFVDELYLACGSVVPSDAIFQFAAMFADQLERTTHNILKERLFEVLRAFILAAGYCTPKHKPKNKKSLDNDKNLFPDVELVNVDLEELEQWFFKRASRKGDFYNRSTFYELRDLALKKKRAPAGFQLLKRASIEKKMEEVEKDEYERLMQEYEESKKAQGEEEAKPMSKKEKFAKKKEEIARLKKAAKEKRERGEVDEEEEERLTEKESAVDITAEKEEKGKKKKDKKRKAPATSTVETTKIVKKNAKGEVVGKQVETKETVVRDNGKEKVTEVTTTTKETAVKKTPVKKGEQKGESEQTNGRKRKDVEPEAAPSPANGKANEKRAKLNAEEEVNGKSPKGKKAKQAEEPKAAVEEVATTPKGKKAKKAEVAQEETTPKGKGKEKEAEEEGVTPKGKGKGKGKKEEMSTPPATKVSEVPPSTGKKAVRFSSENLIKEFDKSTAVNTSPSPTTPKATPVKLKSLLTPPSKKK